MTAPAVLLASSVTLASHPLFIEVSVCLASRCGLGSVCFLRLLDSAVHWILAVSSTRSFSPLGPHIRIASCRHFRCYFHLAGSSSRALPRIHSRYAFTTDLTNRWSEPPPAVHLRFLWPEPPPCDSRPLSAAVAHLHLVRPHECLF